MRAATCILLLLVAGSYFRHGSGVLRDAAGQQSQSQADRNESISSHSLEEECHEAKDSPLGYMFWIDMSVCAFLCIVAGLCSGLTVGLMSLDQVTLEILIKSGEPQQKTYAKRVQPVIKRHHLLLVTLLLSNASALETLPIFLDRMVTAWLAILISVTLVLFFGEVLPMAVCTRHALAIGARTVWITIFLMIIWFPVAWPIAKLLDVLLGHSSGTYYRRAELRELVTIHKEQLRKEEIKIIQGALDLFLKTVLVAMVPLDQVYMLEADSVIDRALVKKLVSKGFSRVPVFSGSRDNVVGLLRVKSLALQDYSGGTTVRSLASTTIPVIFSDTPLYDLLNEFQGGRAHMTLVQRPSDGIVIGIVTLEDVIEELLLGEIEVESDTESTVMGLPRSKSRRALEVLGQSGGAPYVPRRSLDETVAAHVPRRLSLQLRRSAADIDSSLVHSRLSPAPSRRGNEGDALLDVESGNENGYFPRAASDDPLLHSNGDSVL